MGFNVRIIRHGEMELNRPENYDKIIKTGIDGPLTVRGLAEAEALGKHLKDVQFHRAYSSDFIRAQQTAEAILKHSTKSVPEVAIDKRVRERDSGDWEEKTPMDMIKEAMKLQIYPHFLPTPGGESVEQVMIRAAEFLQELSTASDTSATEENVLVATHGAWIACFLEYLINHQEKFELENFDTKVARQPAPTTGVIQIVIGKLQSSGVRRLSFVQLHDQKHLENQVLPD
ncbi:unnamed protein product [Allacma fusca]|uniref:Fructose-2,6-bisphosphatase TIGAR n=1 Tax=Allacma fusca TaxID=39272 RepID=A0A8J2LHR2_9HEXA|nr:unnamed protein product [Allacma fusca]